MIVLDTDVVSELMRAVPAPEVEGWVRTSSDLYTTAVTVAEVGYGVARLPDGHRKDLLGAAAAAVFSAFPQQVLAFDDAAARHYGRIVEHRDRAGTPIDGFDAPIASICRSRGATLATRSTRDFVDTGVALVDPWSSP